MVVNEVVQEIDDDHKQEMKRKFTAAFLIAAELECEKIEHLVNENMVKTDDYFYKPDGAILTIEGVYDEEHLKHIERKVNFIIDSNKDFKPKYINENSFPSKISCHPEDEEGFYAAFPKYHVEKLSDIG